MNPFISVNSPKEDWKHHVRYLNNAIITGNFFDFSPSVRAASESAIKNVSGNLLRLCEEILEMANKVRAIEKEYKEALVEFDKYVEIAEG